MAHARLHLICGNCGCADNWTWEHIPEADIDNDGNPIADVFITCRNCSTLHSLNEKAQQEA